MNTPLFILLLVALPAVWKDWRLSREINISGPGPTTFVCPHEVYDHPGSGLSDIRILDENAAEVPYVLQTRPPRKAVRWREAKVTSRAGRGGGFRTEAVVDVGEEKQTHNTIRLEVPDTDYLWQVEIAVSASPDGDWSVVRSGYPIYRFMPDGLSGSQAVAYPDTDLRYVRLVATPAPREGAQPPTASIKILRAEVGYAEAPKTDWSVFPPIFTPDTSTSILQTWWRSDAINPTIPVTGIRFNVLNREFHRALKISASADRLNWKEILTNEIFRAGGEHPFERMTIELPETPLRYWRIQFYDNGQSPLVVSKIELIGEAYHVVFNAAGNATYRFLFGNGHAPSPSYDSLRSFPPNSYQTASIATLGAEETNTVQRRSLLFWLAIAGGIAVLIGLAMLISLLTEDSQSHPEDKPV